ncbi:MAG: HEPN domain-containing protein [Cyclobacteriaceae bacterium]|nr:HEPN domain-containing protein [Cyclobacteriaceae bacterium]
MKTSLTHLSENKQYEIRRIVDIIQEVVSPEKIILFGSHAKGTQVEHRYQTKDGIIHEYISDYDFLVVTKDNPEKTYVQESKIMDRVDHFNPPVNLEIHEIDYINEGLAWGQYFFADIVKEGILLFDSGKVNFVEARVLTAQEAKEISQQYFEKWFKRANGFISGIDGYISKEEYNVCAFILHQAAESYYYTTLLVFTGYKPKTHNLGKLKKQTKNISEELFLLFPENNKSEKHLFDLLKRGYVDARYKDDYVISKDEVLVLVKRMEKMKSIVEGVCSQKINSIK